MINAFICGMTSEVLIHMLSRENLCMTRELLDVTT